MPENALSPRSVLHFPPQVNRAFSSNSQSTNALLQITRYTCGSASAANVPENALSPRCPLLSPPQVNRAFSSNSQSTNALPQIARYTCGKTPAGYSPRHPWISGKIGCCCRCRSLPGVGFASGPLIISLIPNMLQFYVCANPPRKHAKRPESRGTLHSGNFVIHWLSGGCWVVLCKVSCWREFSQGVGSVHSATTPIIRHIPGGVAGGPRRRCG